MSEPCEVHHPWPGLPGCWNCGLPGDAHPKIMGQPANPFDPCPKEPNPGYDERLRRGLLAK